ncbi:hypothetical protein PCANB_000191 [Pneumocystis canis]|nr:hypothetical protein PCANB_000191 [Pneumocystis canis]
MSLLYDSKNLIEQLRIKYLENFNDGVGEQVIGVKSSGLNKKKYESLESIIDYENDNPLFLDEKDSLLDFKGIVGLDGYKLGDRSRYRKFNTEKMIKRKSFQFNEPLIISSEKIVTNINKSYPNYSEFLNTNKNHIPFNNKVQFKPESVEVFRKNSKDDLNATTGNYCLISGYKNNDNDSQINSGDMKNTKSSTSYSNEILNKSIESIYRNELNPTLSDFNKNNIEETSLNDVFSCNISSNFSRKSCSSHSASKNLSLLTILIKTGKKVHSNPLADIFACLSGKGDLNPLKLKIYRPSGKYPKKPIPVVIKRIATVADAIGFSLYCFIEQKLEPKLTNEQLNPNMWTLRIVEENGELDEDFPALDRTRFLSRFGFDEFALVEATPAQFLENEKITPFNSKISIEHFNSQAKGNDLLNDTSQTLSSFASPKSKTNTKIPESLIPLKIQFCSKVYPLENSVLHVTDETCIANVLDEICKINNLDQTKFILRIAETNIPLSNDCTVRDLKNHYELELIERSYFMIPELERFSNVEFVEHKDHTFKLNEISENKKLVLNKTNNLYQKYVVWRCQPISFMGRHEHILVIDGDYVYIMPGEQKIFSEISKMLSIHANTIVSCKQTDKLSAFKFTVMKSKQLKRYDFEASSKEEASLIVTKINALINSNVYLSTKV